MKSGQKIPRGVPARGKPRPGRRSFFGRVQQREKATPTPPPGAVDQTSWQVFGLTGVSGVQARFLASASRHPKGASASGGSFLFTAAGQSRISTGFPFKCGVNPHATGQNTIYTESTIETIPLVVVITKYRHIPLKMDNNKAYIVTKHHIPSFYATAGRKKETTAMLTPLSCARSPKAPNPGSIKTFHPRKDDPWKTPAPS